MRINSWDWQIDLMTNIFPGVKSYSESLRESDLDGCSILPDIIENYYETRFITEYLMFLESRINDKVSD